MTRHPQFPDDALKHAVASDDEIRAAATRFRSALDAIDPATWTNATVTNFPRGACGHVSELLGRFLRDTMAIEPKVVVRDFYEADGTWISGHAWLEWDGLTIDITGDQFGWAPIIVARDSALHAVGQLHARGPLCNDERWWAIYCSRLYTEACLWLDG